AYMKARGDVTHEAVFVGAAMVATSVGITARVLGDMRVLSTRTAKLILGAAVFDDILGMVLLAVVAGLASGSLEWLHLGILIGEAVTFALFMIFIAPRLVRRIEPQMERLSTQNASLIVALAICLLLSWLADGVSCGHWHDASRRSRAYRGTCRIAIPNCDSVDLRHRGIHDGSYNAACAPAFALFVPRRNTSGRGKC